MKKILFAAIALIMVMVSCVKDPQYPGVTLNVTRNPTAVQANDDVTVTATIASFGDVTAKLVYTIEENEPVTVEMTPGAEKNVFIGVIPGQADGTKVSYYVEAIGDLVTQSSVMEYVVGAEAVNYKVLRFNELNGNDYDETNGNDKYIEIYNEGVDRINLTGVVLVKDGDSEKPVWTGDENVTIEAGGYLVLYSQKSQAASSCPENLIFSSGLSASKPVRMQLFDPAGEQIDDFNLVTCVTPATASYSFYEGKWYHAPATPGAANVQGEMEVEGLQEGDTPEPPTPDGPDYSKLVLNELNGKQKCIELYNMGDVDLSAENMTMYKDGNDSVPIWIGDARVVVPAHGFVVLYGGDEPAVDYPDIDPIYYFNSGLSPKKVVRIALFEPDGTLRDEFIRGHGEWGDKITDVGESSFSRVPDGGEWKLTDPTLGDNNPLEGEEIPQD